MNVFRPFDTPRTTETGALDLDFYTRRARRLRSEAVADLVRVARTRDDAAAGPTGTAHA